MSKGHKLSRLQIAKHSKDRYPTPAAQYAKLLEEIGELAEAMMNCNIQDIEREYADVGLALYALGDKLEIDLIDAMRNLVNSDIRNFAEYPG